ncbi:MAG: hypothetical protein WA005_15755 [Candidatus Binataceae bacterium]
MTTAETTDDRRSGLRYVAFFDILGMSDLILQNHEKAWEILGRIRHEMIAGMEQQRFEVSLTGGSPVKRFKNADYIKYFTFSDSILLFTDGETVLDLLSIVSFCTEFFASAFYRCVPLRGNIAHGEFWFNLQHNVFSGPALVMAYRAAEDPQWMGVTVDSVVSERLNLGLPQAPHLCEWDVPVKSQSEPKRLSVVNWPALHRNAFSVRPPITAEHLYAAAFERVFGPFQSLEPSAQAKYVNTALFINAKLA